MKKKLRKLAALGLSFIMICSLLTACGSRRPRSRRNSCAGNGVSRKTVGNIAERWWAGGRRAIGRSKACPGMINCEQVGVFVICVQCERPVGAEFQERCA